MCINNNKNIYNAIELFLFFIIGYKLIKHKQHQLKAFLTSLTKSVIEKT